MDWTNQEPFFKEHLQPHEGMLRAWLQSRFGASIDIDDVIQESYLKVLKAQAERSVESPKAFLFATARNISLNAIRASQYRGELERPSAEDWEVVDDGDSVQEIVARNQELEIMTQAIQSLPDRCREIFTLRKVYGLQQSEIARELGISARTVNAQISIGVRKCAAFVRNYCREGAG